MIVAEGIKPVAEGTRPQPVLERKRRKIKVKQILTTINSIRKKNK